MLYLGYASPAEKLRWLLQIVMLLPTQLPVDPNNMNYTCVTVGAVMILVMSAWYLPFWGARNWVSLKVSLLRHCSHSYLVTFA